MRRIADPHTGSPNCSILLYILPLLLLCSCSIRAAVSDACSKNSPLVGFSGHLTMVQHQLRGRITILDDCTFTVSGFDMIRGSDDVFWWGAAGSDFQNLTNGFALSESRLNQTFDSLEFQVKLLENVTWEQISVLGVWDSATASDFGHIVLRNSSSGGNITDSKPSLPLTVFDNCLELSAHYRMRWTLLPDNSSVDIGLEAIIPETRYMSFGWADPNKTNYLMLNSDVVVAGFKDRDTAFAEDYFISKYSECNWDFQNPSGVCPDYLYDNTTDSNSVKDVYGQHIDGVALVRYNRLLESRNTSFDVSVDVNSVMTVVWALGPLKPPDSIRPFYWPQNHGGPGRVAFGHTRFALGQAVDKCTGPLIAEEIEPSNTIVADRGSPLVVTVDSAVHYPNPPNPDKVIYINKQESPVLKVERGVPVVFSVQAGYDVAFYVTSDPVGGASNPNETIYAGGPDSHGVPSHPFPMMWLPNRTTPNEVYYQAFFERKMGWKVQVVDGGLSDMYNSSVLLAEQQVTLFWTMTGTNISFAVRGERKSGYLAIAFGRGMVNSFAYIGWVGADGTGYVKSYWIDGRDASNIHPTSETLWDKKCVAEKGALSFEFSRGLEPVCASNDKMCKKNVVDPSVPLKVVWAMGAKWDANYPSDRNMHDRTSRKATLVYLEKGAAEADREVKPVLVVHGFMMFLAWGILFPGGVAAARYLKHLQNDVWFQAHTYLQYSGVTVMALGFVFAAAELRGLHTESLHVKLGLTTMLLVFWQPLNAYCRPKKEAQGRIVWEYLHIYSGRASLVLGLITLVTGMSLLTEIYGKEHVRGFEWALLAWLLMVVGIVGYMELRQFWNKGKVGRGDSVAWDSVEGQVHVLDSDEEDDSAELLANGQPPSRGMEVQLEAFH